MSQLDAIGGRRQRRRLISTLATVGVVGAGFFLAGRGGSLLPAAPSTQFKNRVEIVAEGAYRVIRSNGIPDHKPGQFPNRHNPNAISEQNHVFRVPLEPKPAQRDTPFTLGLFGFAINGVPFDPGAAEFWNRDPNSGWQYEAMSGAVDLGLDSSNAHVQPTGSYHYHGLPNGLIAKHGGKKVEMLLIGYAADGFPIYSQYGYTDATDPQSAVKKLSPSYRVKRGTRPDGPGGKYDGSFVQDYEFVDGAGDLDAANGRFGPTPEYSDGIYHYHLTEAFPYIPRMFHGTPDESFRRRPGPGGPAGRGPGPNGRPPRRPPPPGRRPTRDL